jgi:ribosomal protein S18 acetylase RimI-like enzyme
MSNAATNTEIEVRRLRPTDLEQVIAIDSHHFGEPRRAFFEKRLAHAREHPGDYLQVGVDRNGILVGFAFASILRGEFGRDQAIATLNAVGVMVSSREQGVGRALMDGLSRALRQEGVQSLQSEAYWTNHALLRFFDACGFSLAPRLVLERSALTPLPEPVGAD